MYRTPYTVFQRKKCVNYRSENCSNQERTLQTHAQRQWTRHYTRYCINEFFYCIIHMDMLRRQEVKLMPSFTVKKQVIHPPVLLGSWTNFRFRCYYIILYYCIHEVSTHTHNNHVFTKNNINFIYHSHQHVSLLVFNLNFKLQLQNQGTSIHKWGKIITWSHSRTNINCSCTYALRHVDNQIPNCITALF